MNTKANNTQTEPSCSADFSLPPAPATRTRRRMRRRSKRPTLTASSSSSVSSVRSVVKPSPRRARPFEPLPEFAHLKPDQLEYIHDLLRDQPLADVQQQLYMDLGTRLSISTLHRYRHRLELADQLALTHDTEPGLDNLLDLLAARPSKLDATGLHIVKQRALALAAAPKTSATLLKDLFRIFTYEDRKAEKQLAQERLHTQRMELAQLRETARLQIANRRESTRERLATLAEQRHALELRKQEHREKLAALKAPNPNQDEEAKIRAEAMLAYGLEHRRKKLEATLGATRSTGSDLSSENVVTPVAAPCSADFNLPLGNHTQTEN